MATLHATPADALLALSCSFTAHVLLSFALWVGGPEPTDNPARGASSSAESDEVEVELQSEIEPEIEPKIELGTEAAAPRVGESVDAPSPIDDGGGEVIPRPDGDRAGRGGEQLATSPAVNLAPRDDRLHANPALQSRLERAQEARTRSGKKRRSPEDDRVGPDPMLLTFVADGRGAAEAPSAWAASASGADDYALARLARARSASGADGWLGSERPAALGTTPRDAVRLALPSSGSAASTSSIRSEAGFARPMTIPGRESSPADERGSQQDDLNAEQEVMTLERSWLRASTAGGEQGKGVGGDRGSDPRPAAGGGEGPGFRSRPQGGDGRGTGVASSDPRRRMYLRGIHGKIQRSWSADDFPREAVREGKQGYTIVSFSIDREGNVRDVRVARSSGVPEFDARMRQAVLRAAPFGPLPVELGPVLRHSHEFVVSNPAVRPPTR